MGRFVKHTRCPKCAEEGKDRKGNNLGVYEDGSCYCFSCGHVRGGRADRMYSKENTPKQSRTVNLPVFLPDDVCTEYPPVCVSWTRQYELSVEDLYANKCLWSDIYSRLIFTYYSSPENSLLGWQGRYFGEEDRPKWFSRGDLSSIYHIFNKGESKRFLVLVEDVVSSIKIGKTGIPVMPIFGSHISSKMIQRLSYITDKIIIWLDPDKRKESIKFTNVSNVIGLHASAIFSDHDPKEESYEYIKEKVYEHTA